MNHFGKIHRVLQRKYTQFDDYTHAINGDHALISSSIQTLCVEKMKIYRNRFFQNWL